MSSLKYLLQTCRPLFTSGINSQGTFLVKFVSLAVSLLHETEKFETAMRNLAETHIRRGVRAVEYGIVGDVLFWSLRKCIGRSYDQPTHHAWVKIMSRMLKIIVPYVVAYELTVEVPDGRCINMSHLSNSQPVPNEGPAGGGIAHIQTGWSVSRSTAVAPKSVPKASSSANVKFSSIDVKTAEDTMHYEDENNHGKSKMKDSCTQWSEADFAV